MKYPKRTTKVLDEMRDKRERLRKIVEILQPFEDRIKSINCDHLHRIYKLAKGE